MATAFATRPEFINVFVAFPDPDDKNQSKLSETNKSQFRLAIIHYERRKQSFVNSFIHQVFRQI